MQRDSFNLFKLDKGLDRKEYEYVQRTLDGPRSLEQIVMAQQDEVHQKHCIYGLRKQNISSTVDATSLGQNSFSSVQ